MSKHNESTALPATSSKEALSNSRPVTGHENVSSSPDGNEANVAEEAQLVYLPLSKLVPDADNARKSGGENVDGLKALISSQGLLQNLVVCAHLTRRGKPTDKFGVVAGGRRLRALRALAEEGAIDTDEQILCRVVQRAHAKATSTAENSEREAMSVADTVNGAGVEDLAVAFGITPLTVRRRMKLSSVSPTLFEQFREGKINLDQMMALALSDDHNVQERVWNNASSWNRDSHHLRRAILGEAVDASRNKLAKFVGLGAYTAAGGAVVRDLFAEDDAGYITDQELLQRLATEKLANKVAKVQKEGWAWVETMLSFEYEERKAFTEAPSGRRQPTTDEQSTITAAQRARTDAQAAYENFEESDSPNSDEEGERIYQAAEDASSALKALQASLDVVLPEIKALTGAVVSIDANGKTVVHRSLLRAQDRKRATALAEASKRAIMALRLNSLPASTQPPRLPCPTHFVAS